MADQDRQDLQKTNERPDTNSRRKKKVSKKQIAVIGVIVVLVAVIGVLVYMLFFKPEKQENNMIVTEGDADVVIDELSKKVSEGMFEVKMNTIWSFKDSASPSTDAYLANAAGNTRTIIFDIVLNDTGETVFTSSKIPVGSKIQNLTLDKQLAAGSYPASVKYHLLDEEDQEVSSLAVTVTLNILANAK